MRDLHRRGQTAEGIAQRLGATLEDAMEAHRMLDLPQHGDTSDGSPVRTDAEREAALERIPLRIQKRIKDAGRR